MKLISCVFNLDPASTLQFFWNGAEKLARSGFRQNPASC